MPAALTRRSLVPVKRLLPDGPDDTIIHFEEQGMTSISQKTDERKPRHLKVATVLALGATAVLAGNALLIRNTEPALAASENVASASAFRILTPQAIDRLAGLSGPVAPGGCGNRRVSSGK